MFFGSCHVQRHLSNTAPAAPATTGIQKVGHIVVIYMENRSFDNLYGQFDGADGLSTASASVVTQLDAQGNPYTNLPAIRASRATWLKLL